MNLSNLGPCAFQNKDKIIQSAVLQYLKSKGLEDNELETIMKKVKINFFIKLPFLLPNIKRQFLTKDLDDRDQKIRG